MKRAPMKHVVTMCTFVVLLAGCATASAPHAPASHAGPEILVTFPVERFSDTAHGGSQRAYHGAGNWRLPMHTRATVRRFAAEHGLVERDAWPIETLGVYCVAFVAPSTTDMQRLLDQLAADDRVQLVQLNHSFEGMMTKMGYDDPLFEAQYGQFREKLETLHTVSQGQNVRIGVIDSSVDVEHPDLKGQIARQIEFVESASHSDRLHGTAVAGVIGAAAGNGEGLVGLAPAASIHVYGACRKTDDRTLCSSFTLAKAMAHVIDDDLDVLNISLAGPEDPLLAALIERAQSRGTIVIAADNARDSSRSFPASLAGVHSARAGGRLWFARAEQLSTQAGGGYQVFYGSSIAAAGLTGFAALVRAQHSPEATHRILGSIARCSGATAADATALPVAFALEEALACD